MAWLTSLPVAVTFLAMAVVAAGVAFGSRVAALRLIPVEEQAQVPSIAAPLMPALGAAFAVLVALTLSSEAGYLRAAQDGAGAESAAAGRLAWAATTEGVEPAPIHQALTAYLTAVLAEEWHGDGAARGDGPRTGVALAQLQRAVRVAAAKQGLSSAISGDLLGSLDAMSAARRTRIAAASRDLPILYMLMLVVSGLTLVSNAAVLTFRNSRRAVWLIAGLTLVVALSLSLLLAISAPWRGPLTVSPEPLTGVLRDLQAGFFTR